MRTASESAAEVSHTSPDPARRRGFSPPSRLQAVVARALGLVLGAALAAYTLPGLQVAAGPAPLPLDVSVTLVRSGEVGLVSGGQLLVDAEVTPGDSGAAQGRLQIASQTSVPVNVSVQDVGSPIGLEDELWLRITLGGSLVFDGPQALLRQSSSRSLTIAPGASVPIDVAVSLPPEAGGRAAGRRTEIKLQMVSPAAAAG